VVAATLTRRGANLKDYTSCVSAIFSKRFDAPFKGGDSLHKNFILVKSHVLAIHFDRKRLLKLCAPKTSIGIEPSGVSNKVSPFFNACTQELYRLIFLIGIFLKPVPTLHYTFFIVLVIGNGCTFLHTIHQKFEKLFQRNFQKSEIVDMNPKQCPTYLRQY